MEAVEGAEHDIVMREHHLVSALHLRGLLLPICARRHKATTQAA